MRRTSPSSGLHLHGSSSANSPDVLKIGEAIRRGDLDGYQIDGETVSEGSRVSLSSEPFEPSPYMDFNGAGLLYFASYPTIADTLERQIMCRQNPFGLSSDWALATSTVARDVFYHRNLAIGQCVLATIGHLTRHGDRILLHTRLTCAESTDMLADVFTVKRVGAHRGEFHG